MSIKRSLFPAVLAATLAAHSVVLPAAAGPFSTDDEAAIVAIVEKGMADRRQPGLNVGIWIPGRGAFVRSFGVSDIAKKVPLKREDHVRIAMVFYVPSADATIVIAGNQASGSSNSATAIACGLAKRAMPDLSE